jgi:hypothetical protein
MNGWDLFTWINAMGLLVGVLAIFAGFLRDVGGVLKRAGADKE